MKRNLTIKYEAGHQYNERWGKAVLFCPGCGKQEVWALEGGGDHYAGEQHICMACKGSFYLPNGVTPARGFQDEQRIAGLKE